MADIVYLDITNFRNSPMHRLVLTDEDVPTDRLQFFNPTKESTYDLSAITRTDGGGNERIVGWRFAADFIVAQNARQSTLENLDGWNLRRVDVHLVLKPHASQSHGRLVTLRLRPPVGLTWSVRKGEYGPEILIHITKPLTSLKQYHDGTALVSLWTDDTVVIAEPNP